MNEGAARTRFEAAIGDYRRSFFLVEFLGLEIGYEDDLCHTRFPVEEFFFGPQGSYHGGLLTAIMDITMAHLSKRLTGAAGATMALNTQYLRPLTNGPARCEARFLRQGRSVSFLEAHIWDADGKLTAQATATWKMAEE